MAEVKYTKTELRSQQHRLSQLRRYVPTLQLKKAMLQQEVLAAVDAYDKASDQLSLFSTELQEVASLFSTEESMSWMQDVKIDKVQISSENVAGVVVPQFDGVSFQDYQGLLFGTPVWREGAATLFKSLLEAEIRCQIFLERKASLERELREVSIRLNLFERILIPRTQKTIAKIKVFIQDQQLAAVSQAKVSKKKILARRMA